MILTIRIDSEAQLDKSFLATRSIMNPLSDMIQLKMANDHPQEVSKEDIYKRVLKLEGVYRSLNNAWQEPIARVRVVT